MLHVQHPEMLPAAMGFAAAFLAYFYAEGVLRSALSRIGFRPSYWESGILWATSFRYLRFRKALRSTRLDLLAALQIAAPILMFVCGAWMVALSPTR